MTNIQAFGSGVLPENFNLRVLKNTDSHITFSDDNYQVPYSTVTGRAWVFLNLIRLRVTAIFRPIQLGALRLVEEW